MDLGVGDGTEEAHRLTQRRVFGSSDSLSFIAIGAVYITCEQDSSSGGVPGQKSETMSEVDDPVFGDDSSRAEQNGMSGGNSEFAADCVAERKVWPETFRIDTIGNECYAVGRISHVGRALR
jgi:hypothetical protein